MGNLMDQINTVEDMQCKANEGDSLALNQKGAFFKGSFFGTQRPHVALPKSVDKLCNAKRQKRQEFTERRLGISLGSLKN